MLHTYADNTLCSLNTENPKRCTKNTLIIYILQIQGHSSENHRKKILIDNLQLDFNIHVKMQMLHQSYKEQNWRTQTS